MRPAKQLWQVRRLLDERLLLQELLQLQGMRREEKTRQKKVLSEEPPRSVPGELLHVIRSYKSGLS